MNRVTSLDDPAVLRAVQGYRDALTAGRQPDRSDLLRRFPEIAEELEACLDGLELVVGALPAPPGHGEESADHVDPSTSLGDFRIIRELGRGGMGVVYEAEQISLGRQVALKVLPFAAVLDDRYLRRFKNEARAAARLHHPGIVSVYAVGCDRGVHYYAMQLIEGLTLAEVIAQMRRSARNEPDYVAERTALTAISDDGSASTPQYFRSVARLGIQAAEALEFAHECGIVHRDIKPPNLLVDHRGHLWVADFGLASTRTESELTMTGDLVGTLRYMSPEQLSASREPVDHRTDTYSLAVTLYELLTLERAYPGDDAHAVMREIPSREPPRPRALNPAIPADLETIVLKAMSKDARDRYLTAGELADDLRRFIEDRPIHARRPALRRRVAQWTRRHRTVVWAATTTAALAVMGLAVTTVMIARAHRREQAAHEIALSNFARAEKNLENARALVDRWLTRASNELADVPHTAELRQELLEDALAFYLDFLAERRDDPEFVFETARAYRRVGQIYEWLGRHEDSEPAFDRSIALLEQMTREFPDMLDARRELARSVQQVACRHALLGQYEEAERAHGRALALWEELRAAEPAEAGHRADIALCHQDLAALYHATSRPVEAQASLKASLALCEALTKSDPTRRWYRRILAGALLGLGQMHSHGGRSKEASDLLERHLAVLQGLLDENPSPALREQIATGFTALGSALKQARAFEAAERAYERACETGQALVRDHPSVPAYRFSLGAAYDELGSLYFRMGRHGGQPRTEDARKAYRRAVDTHAVLAELYPAVPAYRVKLAGAHFGSALVAEGREDERGALERCLDVLESLDPAQREHFEQRSLRASATHNLCVCLAGLGEMEEAEVLERRTLELQRALVEDYPDDARLRHLLADWLEDRALDAPWAVRTSKVDVLEEALKHRKLLHAADLESATHRTALIHVRLNLGQAYLASGRTAEGMAEYERALDLGPDTPEVLRHIALVLANAKPPERYARQAVGVARKAVARAPDADTSGLSVLGIALYRAGDWAEAATTLRESIAKNADRTFAHDALFLAMTSQQLGDAHEARGWYKQAVASIQDEAMRAAIEGLRAEAAALLGLSD